MRRKKAYMLLKIDLEKAFDRLKWAFIRETLMFFNLPENLVNLIMSWISTSSIEVLLNGRKINPFLPTRGIRQRDPMSPYLFILCMEWLSRQIDNHVLMGYWQPCKISRKGPKLSHLFFADDLTFFTTADHQNYETINSILQSFHKTLGQRVNLSKSKILFSKNCSETMRKLTDTLGIKEHTFFGKYLGFPMFHKKPTNGDFQFLIDSLRKRLAGWKSKTLTMARRLVLSKPSLSSIPSHMMNYMKLPAKIIKIIDKTVGDFIWGSTTEKKILYLIGLNTISKSKSQRGLGIQKSEVRNRVIHSGMASWSIRINCG